MTKGSRNDNSLQNTFLSKLATTNDSVTIFLMNGIKLEGMVAYFDNFSLVLEREGHRQLVYKHAISTIMPLTPLILSEENDTRNK